MPKRRVVLCAALTLCCFSLATLLASIDSPRLESSDLQYIGGFRLPAHQVNGDDFSLGGNPMAFNPATNGLFVASYRGQVAEVSIPSPVNSSDVNAMPFASYLQPFADTTEGHLADISSGGVGLSGLMVYGSRLHGTASIFYDANNDQRASHYSHSLQLNQPSFSGWSQVSDAGRSGFVSGWMTAVPGEWQAALGGPALTGQCCIPIVWRTSNGPAAFAFNPAQIGQAVVSASPLLYYTLDHATLGPWEGSNPTYGATTQIGGFIVIAGTRTALYIGSNGLGPHCYGNGTSNQSLHGSYGTDGAMWCYDPSNSDKGQHAYPYRYQAWAYDLNDFAAVKAGAKQPWEVVPYAVWPLNFPTPGTTVRLGGVAYDAQRQLIYVAQRGADVDGYASRPVIHVFRLNSSPGSIASPAPSTVSSVTLTADKAAPQVSGTAVTFAAQPSGGLPPYQYKWLISDGVTSTVAVNWTASNQMTWTPRAANPKHVVSVWVRSAGNTTDALEASASLAFPIADTPATGAATSVTLVANRVAPQPPLTAITWTATPVGGVAPHEYKWLVSDGTTTTVAAAWSTNQFVRVDALGGQRQLSRRGLGAQRRQYGRRPTGLGVVGISNRRGLNRGTRTTRTGAAGIGANSNARGRGHRGDADVQQTLATTGGHLHSLHGASDRRRRSASVSMVAVQWPAVGRRQRLDHDEHDRVGGSSGQSQLPVVRPGAQRRKLPMPMVNNGSICPSC